MIIFVVTEIFINSIRVNLKKKKKLCYRIENNKKIKKYFHTDLIKVKKNDYFLIKYSDLWMKIMNRKYVVFLVVSLNFVYEFMEIKYFLKTWKHIKNRHFFYMYSKLELSQK